MERAAKKANTSKFDPSKRYEWDEQDQFSITGREIDSLNRAINAQISTPEFQRMLLVQQAAITMQNFLKECVEQGVIKEAVVKADPSGMKAVTDVPVAEEPSKNGQEEKESTGAMVD